MSCTTHRIVGLDSRRLGRNSRVNGRIGRWQLPPSEAAANLPSQRSATETQSNALFLLLINLRSQTSDLRSEYSIWDLQWSIQCVVSESKDSTENRTFRIRVKFDIYNSNLIHLFTTVASMTLIQTKYSEFTTQPQVSVTDIWMTKLPKQCVTCFTVICNAFDLGLRTLVCFHLRNSTCCTTWTLLPVYHAIWLCSM